MTRSAPRLRLEVVAGPDRGRVLELEGGVYVVGKAQGCDLMLSDGEVSRRHLEIMVLHQGVHLRDLGSTNGSFLGDARLDSQVVGPGVSVKLGKTELALVGEGLDPELPSAHAQFGDLIGGSEVMRRLYDTIARVGPVDVPVLVQGEVGTGKALVSHTLHRASARAQGPFVVCDVGALPRRMFESEDAFAQASGGTLFLNEIADLAPEGQPILLAAINQHQLDVRVIASTKRDLAGEVKANRFQEDLHARLSRVRLDVPALRHRRPDVPLLAQHFVARASHALQRRPPDLPHGLLAALQHYDWPGNVRELEDVLSRACVIAHGPILDPRVLGLPNMDMATPPVTPLAERIDAAIPFHRANDRLIDAWERESVGNLLTRHAGNVSEAARAGGIDRVALYRLLRKHGLWSGE